MNLPKLAISRPVFINCIVIMIMVLGVISYRSLGVDQFPDVNFPFVMVMTEYPGAGPEEIETQVTKPFEDELSTLQGVKNVTSTSQEGNSMVMVEFTLETPSNEAEQRVRDKVSYVKPKLPQEAKEPVIRRFDPSDQPICLLGFQSTLKPTEAYDLADQTIRPRLSQIPNVGLVEIFGGTKREVRVELDRTLLNQRHISASDVVRNVNNNGLNIPVGKFDLGGKNLLFRSVGEYRDLDRIRKTVVNFFGSDVPVTVSDVGTVVDSFEEPKTHGLLNGQPALVLLVYKQSGANTVAVVDQVARRIGLINKELAALPGQSTLRMLRDNARPIRMNLDDVKGSIALGILLTVIVVFLFLGSFRSTVITATALPVSLLGAFILMYLSGFTINMLTLLALSLAVGLLIDDAIVVRENIWRRMELGMPARQAALEGTLEVALAVVATTSVVLSVFFPIAFLKGIVGQFFRQFGLTVCAAMAVSLFESMTMGPMLSANWARQTDKHLRANRSHANPLYWFGRFQDWMDRVYARIMRWTLRYRKTTVAAAVAVFFMSLGIVRLIPATFMPEGDHGEFQIQLKANPNTSLPAMREYVLRVDEMLRKHPEVEQVIGFAGDSTGETHTGSMYIKMVPFEKRRYTVTQFKDLMRKELAPLHDELQPQVGDISIVGGGEDYPIMINIKAPDYETLVPLVDGLVKKLAAIPKFVDLGTNYDGGKQEFQIKLDPEKMVQMGVSGVEAGMELRTQVEGSVPSKFREHGLEYDLRVRMREDQRNLHKFYPDLFVPNQNKNMIRLSDISTPVMTLSPSKINRHNRTRYIMVHGQLAAGGAVGPITAEARKILAAAQLPPGVTYEFMGQSEDLEDLIGSILIAMLLALLFTYMVLSSLYESFILPLAIMMAIPMAVVGAFAALYVTHQQLNIFSMIALIMLIGLVTKNSILLVDFALQLQRAGMSRDEALVKAGITRLRPIVMTTLALIAGMSPLALALTEVAKFRQSMGIAVIGGLISSLFLTLLIVPAFFGFVDDFRLWLRRLFSFMNPHEGKDPGKPS